MSKIPTLRESNQKMTEKICKSSEEFKATAGSLKARWGVDVLNEAAFPVQDSNFSWSALREKIATHPKFREADTASVFTQFLRAGVNVLATNAYVSADETYGDWLRVINSKKAFELYAPFQGVGFPRQVGPVEIYPEVGAAALDMQLANYKFGSVYSVQKELLDDDTTGQFQQGASQLGIYLKGLTEVWVYGKLASVASMQYADLKIPISETKPTTEANYPYTAATAPMVGGGYNRPATFTIVTKAALQAAFVALRNQKNLQGLKMGLNPNRLICGENSKFDAATLLNSTFYPVGSGSAGQTGNSFALSPIKGLYDLTVSRFIAKNDGTFNGDSYAWYVTDDKFPGFVLQLREGPAVVQEATNAGESFNRDIYRFKGSVRLNADFLDPRGFWLGNNGSVTS